MSMDPLFYMHTAEAEPAIPELSVETLRAELRLADQRVLPAAAEGTVVGSCGDGQGYVVEFDEPCGGRAAPAYS